MDIIERLELRLTDENGAPDSEVLADCVETAKNAILSRRFPLQEWPTDDEGHTYVEDRYLDLQMRIAIDLYNKIGAEGEINHQENGIRREYESSWISKQLLDEVVPFVGVFAFENT